MTHQSGGVEGVLAQELSPLVAGAPLRTIAVTLEEGGPEGGTAGAARASKDAAGLALGREPPSSRRLEPTAAVGYTADCRLDQLVKSDGVELQTRPGTGGRRFGQSKTDLTD